MTEKTAPKWPLQKAMHSTWWFLELICRQVLGYQAHIAVQNSYLFQLHTGPKPPQNVRKSKWGSEIWFSWAVLICNQSWVRAIPPKYWPIPPKYWPIPPKYWPIPPTFFLTLLVQTFNNQFSNDGIPPKAVCKRNLTKLPKSQKGKNFYTFGVQVSSIQMWITPKSIISSHSQYTQPFHIHWDRIFPTQLTSRSSGLGFWWDRARTRKMQAHGYVKKNTANPWWQILIGCDRIHKASW